MSSKYKRLFLLVGLFNLDDLFDDLKTSVLVFDDDDGGGDSSLITTTSSSLSSS